MRPVNLLPDKRRRARKSDGRRAQMVVAALALLVLMVAVYTLTARQVNERRAKAEQVRQEAQQLQAQQAQLGAFGQFARLRQAREQAVKQLAQQRFDWERFLREVSLVMPASGWLTEAQASVTGLSSSTASPGGSGGASGAATSAGQASGGPEANLSGCLRTQSDVARLMVRLRQLHRVKDVELTSSEQENPDEAPSSQSCGRFYKFQVRLLFDPAPAAVEAPQGSSKVPAKLGGGS